MRRHLYLILALSAAMSVTHADGTNANRVAAVMNTPGCVAFWDFVKREPDGAHRFTAHVPAGATMTSRSMRAIM